MTEPDTITLAPQAGPQTDFFRSSADIVIYGGAAGGGKAATADTKVVTPFGLKAIGSLKVGDKVIAGDGSHTNVIGVYPQGVRDTYKITFQDGVSCVVDKDHLWNYSIARKGKWRKSNLVWKVGTTAQLRSLSKHCKVLIPMCGKVKFTKSYRPEYNYRKIDPYVLGVLLGDGCLRHRAVSFSGVDIPLIDMVKSKTSDEWSARNDGISYGAKGELRKDLIHWLEKLKVYGCLSHQKFVPNQYKFACIDDRLEVLRGLMDTDGTAHEGKAYYTSVSKQLASDVQFLVRSLGGRATMTDRIPTNTVTKKKGRRAYTIYIRMPNNKEIFHLERKKAKANTYQDKTLKRSIVSIEESEPTECVCIAVAHPSSLFLITDGFIVTHNTYGLLLEGVRHLDNKDFRFALFRRTQQQLAKAGGLWDESQKIYSLVNGIPREQGHKWKFPSGAQGEFSGMQYEKDKLDFQGAQICYMGFDQLEQFTETQFMFMLSRNRSTCGVSPYIRANANPEPGWLADFLAWWIAEDGYADMKRAGKIRWLVRDGDKILWFADEKRAIAKFGLDKDKKPVNPPLSVTFIPASVYDNKILLETDPKYIANLMALPTTERKRLLGDRERGGNWHIKPGGTKFKREWFPIVDDYPHDALMVRYWDLAATAPKKGKNPDYTAGALMAMKDGQYWIVDMRHDRLNPAAIEKLLGVTWQQDGQDVPIRMEEEGGSSGKISVQYFARHVLVGADFAGIPSTKSKEIRANPVSGRAEAGNVFMVKGEWNKACLDELESFSPECDHDDQVDAISGGFAFLSLQFMNPSVYSDGSRTYASIALDKDIETLLDGMNAEERAEALRYMNDVE